jgi:hypothetical protein
MFLYRIVFFNGKYPPISFWADSMNQARSRARIHVGDSNNYFIERA